MTVWVSAERAMGNNSMLRIEYKWGGAWRQDTCPWNTKWAMFSEYKMVKMQSRLEITLNCLSWMLIMYQMRKRTSSHECGLWWKCWWQAVKKSYIVSTLMLNHWWKLPGRLIVAVVAMQIKCDRLQQTNDRSPQITEGSSVWPIILSCIAWLQSCYLIGQSHGSVQWNGNGFPGNYRLSLEGLKSCKVYIIDLPNLLLRPWTIHLKFWRTFMQNSFEHLWVGSISYASSLKVDVKSWYSHRQDVKNLKEILVILFQTVYNHSLDMLNLSTSPDDHRTFWTCSEQENQMGLRWQKSIYGHFGRDALPTGAQYIHGS